MIKTGLRGVEGNQERGFGKETQGEGGSQQSGKTWELKGEGTVKNFPRKLRADL